MTGSTYNNYAWGTTDAERGTGWHKFEWVIDSGKGLTEKIDGKVISTNKTVGKDYTDPELFKVENYDKVKSLKSLTIMNGWSDNSTNRSEISNRHFIDGVSVVKNGAATQSKTLTSVEIPVKGITYTVSPETFEADSKYPEAQTLYISPYMENDTDIVKVLVGDKELNAEQWTAKKGEAPLNASNYPAEMKGYQVTLNADVFKGLADGEHKLTMVTAAGENIPVTFTVKASAHVATNYYLSNGGNDDADGHTPETAWKTFEKLQSVTFGPGDRIYLDATSTWSGVQFRPEGSGTPGNPIIMTKYNDGGDSSKRPVLNGDGTVADLNAHSYLAFDAWRKFYPSGTIELFNVEQWEIRGIEVTNYTKEMQKGATGRNGIAVIFDYFETQGLETLPTSNAEKEKAFYRAGKLQHVVIEDCYVHDVVGYHPVNGAKGAGGKMSGGINAYGPYDDLQINNNIVMYCDVEGIRNDVLAWMGDTRTQFPAYMENVSISNNYIAGVPGDGVVISSANKPVLENNYLTDAGYSYYATSNSGNVSGSVTWNTEILSSCRAVEEKTGAVAKDMGNRQAPMTMGSPNFAGLWFIGTKDAVAQYNEAVNNVWVCNDSEAFDADMFCWGTVFQYNYTYRNNGGFCLFMGTMDDGTLVRYNVSVEDAQSVGISESQNGLFHYSGAPEAIYNNLFILGDKVATIFGGPANTAYFYNNIVIAPNGLTTEGKFGGFHINGSSDGTVSNPKLSGEMKNNLFYPAAIVDSVVEGSTVVLENNITLNSKEELNAVFENLDGFMSAQPVKALLGRSDFTGDKVEQLEGGKGAGVAMSPEAGRGVKTPTGGFDLSQFEGIKLAEKSPAIGKGMVVDREYDYKEQNEAALPLTKDFFNNDITGMTVVDIGPFQYSVLNPHECVFDQKNTDEKYLKSEATCTEPAVYYYSCECGAVGTETFTFGEALGHDLVQHEGKEATCTEVGWKPYVTCTRGDYTTYEEIPMVPHTEVIDPAKEATCTETGLTEGKHCSVCGEVLVKQEVVPKKAHTEVIDPAKEATCTETGLTEGKHCSVCGEVLVKQEVVPKKAHTEVIDPAKEATCTETGLTEGKHCSVCGEVLVKQEVVPKKAHTEVIDPAKEATCTETGLTEGKHCSVCGEVLVKQEVVPKKAHTEVIDPAKEATCTETGLTEGKHCSVCGEIFVKQEVIPALGHDLVKHEGKEATCTEAGWEAYETCTRGDYSTYKEIPATGHSFGDWKDSGDGKTHTSSCACGEVKTEDHKWDDGIVTVEPTQTKEGKKVYTCYVCGGQKTETLAVLPPTPPTGDKGMMMYIVLLILSAGMGTGLVVVRRRKRNGIL